MNYDIHKKHEYMNEASKDKNSFNQNTTYREIRARLVSTALEWEKSYGVAPGITSAISEIDAAELIGAQIDKHTENQISASKLVGFELEPTYSDVMQDKSAVSKGYDFKLNGYRYQVKANRPSGKKGSFVTRAPKPSNLDWDFLIYMLYNKQYELQETWLWKLEDYIEVLHGKKYLGPKDYREGLKINVNLPSLTSFTWGENTDLKDIPDYDPQYKVEIDKCVSDKLELNLHQAINSYVSDLIKENNIELPKIEQLFEQRQMVMFFKVYGLYGGFLIWLDTSQRKLVLYARGFSRISEGSERLFKIDTDGYQLIKIGKKLA